MMNMAIDPNGNYIYVNGVSRNSPPPYTWNTFWKRELWRYDILNDVYWDLRDIPIAWNPNTGEIINSIRADIDYVDVQTLGNLTYIRVRMDNNYNYILNFIIIIYFF